MEKNSFGLPMETVAACTSILVFVSILHLSRYHPEKKVLRACEEFVGLLREHSQRSTWYLRKQQFLCRNGALFHYGKWVNPTRYLVLRIVVALLGLIVLWRIAPGYGVLMAVLLFFLPEWLLLYLNKRDNERLLPEIKLIYHALEIQIRAGVYVTDALSECYGSVQEQRLQQALLDLAGDIVMKADILDALGRFQGKFDNRYIDALCITIIQACESGQAVELLSDIGEQLKDMETAVIKRKKSSLDRSVTFYQLGILAAVMGIIVYACVTHMFTAVVKF